MLQHHHSSSPGQTPSSVMSELQNTRAGWEHCVLGSGTPKNELPWCSSLLLRLAAAAGAERCSLFSTGAETLGAKKNARSYKKAGEQRDIHGELQSAAS